QPSSDRRNCCCHATGSTSRDNAKKQRNGDRPYQCAEPRDDEAQYAAKLVVLKSNQECKGGKYERCNTCYGQGSFFMAEFFAHGRQNVAGNHCGDGVNVRGSH